MCAGPSWGSTTSEASTEAVRLACKQLVATLKPHFAEAGENATWQEVILKVHPEVGFNASKVRDPVPVLLSMCILQLLWSACILGVRTLDYISCECPGLPLPMLAQTPDRACMLHCVHRFLIEQSRSLQRRTSCVNCLSLACLSEVCV